MLKKDCAGVYGQSCGCAEAGGREVRRGVKRTATAVPGRKIIVKIAIVFIEALSFMLASAIRRDVSAISRLVCAIWRLRRMSRWTIMLKI